MNLPESVAFLPAFQLKEMVRSQEISAVALTNFFLERIEAANPSLNAFLYIDADDARAYAEKVDTMVARKDFSKPLLGLPLIVPDVLNMQRTPTTFGSLLLENVVPEEDEIEIAYLKEAGAVILGKTNLAEFGLFPDTVNRLGEACRNPHNPAYSPGGPSGGGAAAVAAGLASFALATDVSGSLRLTASHCGLAGLIPTRGRVPTIREHLLPYSEKMYYRKGAIARHIRDIAMMLNVLADPDPRDLMCTLHSHEDYESLLEEQCPPFRIAWSCCFDFLPVDPEVAKVVEQGAERLRQLGHIVEEVELGIDPDVYAHFRHIMAVDRYIMIMGLLRDNPAGYDLLAPYTRDWLKMGDHITGVQYSLAHTYGGWVKQRLDTLFGDYDMLLSPVVAAPPFPTGKPPTHVAGVSIDPYLGLDAYTCPFNMSGHPVLTLPCGKSNDGLPIGIQLAGPYWGEGKLLQLGKQYEKQIGMAD